jgi:transcription elongation GreA/GreB family factor
MMQIELEKNENQRQKSRELLKYLSQIDLSKTYNKVDFGSFICSKEHFYFLAIGYGKMIIDDSQVFVLSLASPIGQQLKHKKVGDSIQFQNQTIEILEII